MQDFVRIFQGVAIKPVRDYLLSQLEGLRGKYSKFIVPCAGGLNAAELAVKAGWKAEQIYTSDISLFTSVLGYALTNQPIEKLGVEFNSSFLHDLNLKPTAVEDILFALKLSTLPQKNFYQNSIVQYYLRTRDSQAENLKSRIIAMRSKLSSMAYQVADMWQEINKFKDDPTALFWINPPGYKNGYSKMYDTKGAITWREPAAQEFDPSKEHEALFKTSDGAAAYFVLYPHCDVPAELKEKIIFGFDERSGKKHRLVANRPGEVKKAIILNKKTDIKAAKYPLLPADYEITETTKVTWVRTTKEVCLYYRDLFAHKLGSTKSEMYFLVLLDGYIISAFGLFVQNAAMGKSEDINETFCFSHPHPKYYRLNKLSMMTITCEQCLQEVKKYMNLEGRTITGLQTTCLAPHPDLKPNRGILKLISRKELKRGYWHLSYHTLWHKRNFQECLKLWLLKEIETGRGLRQ